MNIIMQVARVKWKFAQSYCGERKCAWRKEARLLLPTTVSGRDRNDLSIGLV
jgi:hypothetical protein